MTPTNPIPEGMKAYSPEHPDYPNAPSDWDSGDLLLDWGDDDDTQPRFTTCQQEEIDWSAPPNPWRHDIDTDKFALIVAYTPKPTPQVGDSAAERARDFGAQLKAARERLNFTLRDVEEITAGVVSNPYLCQIENGKIASPSFKVVCALAAAYAVSLDTMRAWAAFASQEAAHVGRDDDCRFCGATYASGAVRSIKSDDKVHPYRVTCSNCGGSTAHHGDFQASWRAWTRRPAQVGEHLAFADSEITTSGVVGGETADRVTQAEHLAVAKGGGGGIREAAIRARRYGSCPECGSANGHDFALGGVFCTNPKCVTHDTPTTARVEEHSCTCHPDDRPEGTCPQKYAASECNSALAERPAMPMPDRDQ